MSGKKGQNNNSMVFKSISTILAVSILVTIILTGMVIPAGAANTTVTATATTVTTTKATTATMVTPTLTTTVTKTATTIPTMATTSAATSVQTTVATTTPTQTTTMATTATTAVPVTTTNSTTGTATPTPTANTTATTTLSQSTQVQPVAGFSSDISSGPAPLTVQFTDLSSGGPISWSWTFGDGSTDTVQNPSHTYQNSGTFTVSLVVNNPEGATYSSSQSNYISVDSPVTVTETETQTETTETGSTAGTTITAGFSGSPMTGTAPLMVIFTDSSTGSPTSWNWDFGDGSQSTIENPSHTYTVPGSYTVSLSVSGTTGTNVKLLTNYITVTGVSTPDMTETPVPVFTNDNTGPVQTTPINPAISRQSTVKTTPEVNPGELADQSGVFVYLIIIGVIAGIIAVAVILYRRGKDWDQLG